jgi:diguanylate cyclase (GGDEF)-like protein
MILLPGTGSDHAFEIAERIRKAFEAIPFPQAGHRTVSLGVTQRKGHEDEDSFVLRVDQALYKAKSEGKNRSILL